MTQLSNYSKIIAGEWKLTLPIICADGITRQCIIEEYVEGFAAFVVCADGRYTNHHCYKTSRGALRAAGNWRNLPPAPPAEDISSAIPTPVAETVEAATARNVNEIAEETDAVFAACQTETELFNAADAAITFINRHFPTAGALVAYVTASFENALARIRAAVIETARADGHFVVACRACGRYHTTRGAVDSVRCSSCDRDREVSFVFQPPVEDDASFERGSIAHIEAVYTARGYDHAVAFVDGLIRPMRRQLAADLNCADTEDGDGAEIIRAIMGLLAEIKREIVGATVFVPSLNGNRVVIDYAPKTNIVVVKPGYAGRDDRQGFRLGSDAVLVAADVPARAGTIIIDRGEDVDALAEEIAEADRAAIAAVAAPAEHASRQRVIDRALETGRKYEDDQVANFPLLRAVALDFVKTYRGTNSFVQNIAVNLVDFGTLSDRQLRGALNVMVAEARFERAEAQAARALENVAVDQTDYEARGGDFHVDLRRKSDREIEAAGEANAPADSANEVAPAIPNGFYTVIIDPTSTPPAYRTLRVGDCPKHFTVKPGTQLISFLSGADNTSDYTGFAFLSGSRVSIWSKFKTADALRQAANLLVADPMTGAREYVLRSNRCFVCNRPLTTPESIARGIGPICAEAIGAMGFHFLMGTREAAVEENTNRDRFERTSGAEAALKRARERQAASGPIDQKTAQTEMDELFPE